MQPPVPAGGMPSARCAYRHAGAPRRRGRCGGAAPDGETGEGALDAVAILLLCGALGLLGRNHLIVAAALCLLGLRLLGAEPAIRWLGERGSALGIFLLLASLLAPVASERLTLKGFGGELLRPSGIVGAVVAAGAAYLGRGGLGFLREYPAALVGMIVGSVLGTVALGGVPTGPLIAAGTTALLLEILGWR